MVDGNEVMSREATATGTETAAAIATASAAREAAA
ncbi:MAG: hypothetical protein JWP79_2812, partial [Polaromonas sp.]|nr:hypothetical protein [Polaromonas sp.]